ncbi:hypothetical protein HH308_06250 [Gordonia sp. TBRC 11910]|uniref:Uncharacterized protein n=1 Tax=Gordonia asplenii TaxID=2725283 RepID=A0A848KWH9_9ACTN|nr:hypothetical protein [Gordonia asplenii]NMO00813.1 hypothetical protein [Gordonia asplenii]
MTPEHLLDACEVAVVHALEQAGKRTKTLSRGERFQLVDSGVPQHDIHMCVHVDGDQTAELDRLLRDAWTALAVVYPALWVRVACDEYTRALILARRPHDRDALRRFLETACEHASATAP